MYIAPPRRACGEKEAELFVSAAHTGDIEIVQSLLQGGIDPNVESTYFGLALQGAASGGYRDMVHLLIKGGADVQGGFFLSRRTRLIVQGLALH